MESEKLLLRPIEAAAALAIGRSKMYELIAAGAVPAIRVGHSHRIPVTALRRWIDQQAAAPVDVIRGGADHDPT